MSGPYQTLYGEAKQANRGIEPLALPNEISPIASCINELNNQLDYLTSRFFTLKERINPILSYDNERDKKEVNETCEPVSATLSPLENEFTSIINKVNRLAINVEKTINLTRIY